MSIPQMVWPEPDKLFEWLGEANLSRDNQSLIVAISAEAVQKVYAQWFDIHREASDKIEELQNPQDVMIDKIDGALEARIERLKMEVQEAREGADKAIGLEHQLPKSQEEVVA